MQVATKKYAPLILRKFPIGIQSHKSKYGFETSFRTYNNDPVIEAQETTNATNISPEMTVGNEGTIPHYSSAYSISFTSVFRYIISFVVQLFAPVKALATQ